MSQRLLVLVALFLAACAGPQIQSDSNTTQAAALYPQAAVMADGYRLPLAMYRPAGKPRAIMLGLHGFNDYHNAFREPGRYLAARGILTAAYDQRGFGATEQRGIWPGRNALQQDAATVARLLCRQYPGTPLYLLGESMGGAVSIMTAQPGEDDCIQGVILVAPAIWGWQTMPLWQATVLRLAAWLFPASRVTADGLDIKPSDNIEMLRALGRDPMVIKATRIDTLYGLTGLMEEAYRNSGNVTRPVLLLYGEHDEVIPRTAMCRLLTGQSGLRDVAWRLVLYPEGYHMLTRDLQAATVLNDIAAWITGGRDAVLPSGFAVSPGGGALDVFCAGT
ncbi:MAG: alpha/beta hydrolase [Pseudomonadota bacterium]